MVLYAGNNHLNKTGGGVIITEEDIKKNPERFNAELYDYSLETFKDKIGFKVVSDNFPVYEGGKKAYLIRHNTLINKALEFIKDNPKIFRIFNPKV